MTTTQFNSTRKVRKSESSAENKKYIFTFATRTPVGDDAYESTPVIVTIECNERARVKIYMQNFKVG